MNVLLVDDDPEMRLIVGFVLREAGHVLTEAASAADAAARMAEVRFDVVLMDVMLGEDDGISVAERLLTGTSDARLVFLTGATRDAQQQRMAAAGAAGILHKPFDPATLADELHRILEAAGP